MKRVASALAVAGLLVAPVVYANIDDQPVNAYSPALEVVSEINFSGRLDGWRVVDKSSIIVWTTPFRPYLLQLRRPAYGLNFAQTIGVSSVGGTVHAKLDTVYVDGFRYPIQQIFRLSRDQAKQLGG